MQATTEDTDNAERYESLTDTSIAYLNDKSYTELSSDAWNEIFPLRKPLASQPTPVEHTKKQWNVSTDTDNLNAKCERQLEHAKENVADDATVCSNAVNLNQKNSCAIYVSRESDCPHDYDYIQDGRIIYPQKINEVETGSNVTSKRALPVPSQDTYEPLRKTTKEADNKIQFSRRKCLLISGSLLVLIVIASAVIIGIVFGISNSRRGNLLVLDDVQGDGQISGIAVLHSELFVIRYKMSPAVNVYNTNNFTFARSITINGSSQLRAIVANLQENCLYISDTGLNVGYRYNLTNDVITHQWPIGGKSYGLSLTSSGNVLVAVRTFINRIEEYTPAGIFVRNITLAVTNDIPWQSVQLSGGNFVTNLGVVGSIHRVCAVDGNGSTIQCYGGAQGQGDGQLDKPGQLAVDIQDNVYVTDTGNDRIVLLSPSLMFLSYVAVPGYQLNNPWALCLDRINRRLYVGEWTSTGRVFAVTV